MAGFKHFTVLGGVMCKKPNDEFSGGFAVSVWAAECPHRLVFFFFAADLLSIHSSLMWKNILFDEKYHKEALFPKFSVCFKGNSMSL